MGSQVIDAASDLNLTQCQYTRIPQLHLHPPRLLPSAVYRVPFPSFAYIATKLTIGINLDMIESIATAIGTIPEHHRADCLLFLKVDFPPRLICRVGVGT